MGRLCPKGGESARTSLWAPPSAGSRLGMQKGLPPLPRLQSTCRLTRTPLVNSPAGLQAGLGLSPQRPIHEHGDFAR